MRTHVVVPTGHRLAKRASLKPQDLRGESLVVPPEGRPHRVQIDAVMSQANVPWSIGVEADGWELMQHFVTQGIGLSIVNDCVPVPRGTRAIALSGFPDVHYQLVWKRSMLNQRVERLLELIMAVQP